MRPLVLCAILVAGCVDLSSPCTVKHETIDIVPGDSLYDSNFDKLLKLQDRGWKCDIVYLRDGTGAPRGAQYVCAGCE